MHLQSICQPNGYVVFLFAAQLQRMVPLADVKEALAQARATSRARMEEALAAGSAQVAQVTRELEAARAREQDLQVRAGQEGRGGSGQGCTQ
jgi:hypothetical protein